MNSRRNALLMAVLLCLLGYYVWDTQFNSVNNASKRPHTNRTAVLSGENQILDVAVETRPGWHTAKIKYFYRGDFKPAMLRVTPLISEQSKSIEDSRFYKPLRRGEHEQHILLRRAYQTVAPVMTRFVRVEMLHGQDKVIAVKTLERPLDWLGSGGRANEQPEDIQTLYEHAVAEIDHGTRSSLGSAKSNLEKILSKDPDYVPAFPELARYHMKTNWGPEGLKQAEGFLNSGLEIDATYANSYVLLGYVYAHQKRFAEAEQALKRATELGTENLWLWANWGELHAMQGNFDASIDKYTRAVAGVRPYSTYDRAQLNAYTRLIELLLAKQEVERADVLLQKRSKEYQDYPCMVNEYAEFRLRWFKDADAAITLARQALDGSCLEKDVSRSILGAGYYVKWDASRKTEPSQAQMYRKQARLYFAEGPALIYWLARAENTANVINALAADDVPVDIADNEGRTALALALQDRDTKTVERLITLGADVNRRIGEDRLPILIIPVLNNDLDLVGVLLERNADVGVRVGGVSLWEIAEQLGHGRIAKLLRKSVNRPT